MRSAVGLVCSELLQCCGRWQTQTSRRHSKQVDSWRAVPLVNSKAPRRVAATPRVAVFFFFLNPRDTGKIQQKHAPHDFVMQGSLSMGEIVDDTSQQIATGVSVCRNHERVVQCVCYYCVGGLFRRIIRVNRGSVFVSLIRARHADESWRRVGACGNERPQPRRCVDRRPQARQRG